MHRPRTLGFLLLALISGACGGSDGPSIPPATCTPGMMTLLGELDGEQVDAATAFSSWSFQQISQPRSLDLPPDGSLLHLAWSGLISTGGTGAVSGRVVMPAGAPRAGETICAASGTLTDNEISNGTDYIFTLTNLSSGPTCPGTSLAGSLAGCAETLR